MYRFRPDFDMRYIYTLCSRTTIIIFNYRAYPIEDYPCRTQQAAAMMIMIMNNLDPRVAQVHV